MKWRLAEAKNRFSKVVNLALLEEPQQISRGEDTVVLLSIKEYDWLTGKQMGIKDYLVKRGSFNEFDLTQDKFPMAGYRFWL